MFKSFDDLEANLTMQEISKMLEKAREMKYNDQRFAASLKGIDLDEGKTTEFDKIKRRAEAKARGVTEEQLELSGHFNIIVEDE